MASRYGCRSGYGTPIHITLIPPFRLPDTVSPQTITETVTRTARLCAEKNILPFPARVHGFGSFSDRTLFAHIEPAANWNLLRELLYDALSDAVPRMLHRDRRPFTPHITIANRDIPDGAATKALEYFSSFSLEQVLTVDSVTIFIRNGNRWIPDTTAGCTGIFQP